MAKNKTSAAAQGPEQKPSRNDRCWCESGKKYKSCHLDSDNVARPESGSEAPATPSPWSDVEKTWLPPLVAFARARAALPGELKSPEDDLLVLDHLFNQAGPDGRSSADLFAAGKALPPEATRWLSSQAKARSSIYSVQSVQPGRRLNLVDLFTGQSRSVVELSATEAQFARTLLFARVVTTNGESWLSCAHPLTVPDVLAPMVRDFAAAPPLDWPKSKPISDERARDPRLTDLLYEVWGVLRETVLAASRTALAGVRNPDGHALAFVKDVYDAPDAAAVTSALDAHAAFLRTSPTEWTWVRADERDPNRELGVLTLEGRKLVAEVNSIERADHLRGLVADSKVTRHIGRTTEEAEQVLKRLGYDAPAGVVNVPRALPRRRL